MKPIAIITASITLLCGFAFAIHRDVDGADSAAAVLPAEKGALPTVEDSRPDDSLIVHEWGTFTSFSGSDGVKLEFRPLVTNDLPSFVSNRAKASGHWVTLFTKPSLTALQRMETPVTYFYTPVERDVTVKVEFPEGLLTEFYPPIRHYEPSAKEAGMTVVQESHVATAPPLKNSMIDWGRVHLIPTASLKSQVNDEELSRRIGRYVERTLVPEAKGFQHYAAARATDSAIVQVRHPEDWSAKNSTAAPTDYFEKFLFYRGVGNFELPLTLSEDAAGGFVLENAGADDVRTLFLVTVEGDQVRYQLFDGLAAHSRRTLVPSNVSSTIDDLAMAMISSLIKEGLYEKEARAMVTCWRSSWFGEEGTRLLYTVPENITDELLPLHIDPQPDVMVRVLVGRMEIMSTSAESHIRQLVQTSAQARQTAQEKPQATFRSPSLDELQAMGRLAEPALIRVRHIETDENLRNEATLLVEELQKAHQDQRTSATEPAP